jgi:hypothetical protein
VYARSTTIQAQPLSIDAGITYVRDVVLPALTGMTACVGLSQLVDRDSGRCIATSAWQSADAMHASAEQIRPIRARGPLGRLGCERSLVDEPDGPALRGQRRPEPAGAVPA